MPDIDVNDVLLGSAIAGETFVVQRRQETVTQQGKSTIKTFNLPAVGSIQPEGDNEMIRETDFDTQSNSIEVITPFRLRGASVDAAGKEFKADIVLWNGNSYVVKTVNDYTAFGRGWVLAQCTSEDFVDQPPT
jgi:galactose-6-phosphate isomerase